MSNTGPLLWGLQQMLVCYGNVPSNVRKKTAAHDHLFRVWRKNLRSWRSRTLGDNSMHQVRHQSHDADVVAAV